MGTREGGGAGTGAGTSIPAPSGDEVGAENKRESPPAAERRRALRCPPGVRGRRAAQGGEPGLRGGSASLPRGEPAPSRRAWPPRGAGQRLPQRGRDGGAGGSPLPGSAARWAGEEEEEEEGGATSATEKFLPATIFPAAPSAPRRRWPRPGNRRGRAGSGRAALGAAPVSPPASPAAAARWDRPRDGVHLAGRSRRSEGVPPRGRGRRRAPFPAPPLPAGPGTWHSAAPQPRCHSLLPGSYPALRPAEEMMGMMSRLAQRPRS